VLLQVRAMKKISALLILSAAIIATCMIYLVFTGISLRSAPLIQPSLIAPDQSNIAASLVSRLFREFQTAHYILWGALPETQISEIILKQTAIEYEKKFYTKVNFIQNAEMATIEQIRACKKPCWLLLSDKKAHQLKINNFIEKNMSGNFISLTLVLFNKIPHVTKDCEIQKRLELSCLISVSIRDVQRKMKDPKQRYFFLRKYNENDFFLFVQQPGD